MRAEATTTLRVAADESLKQELWDTYLNYLLLTHLRQTCRAGRVPPGMPNPFAARLEVTARVAAAVRSELFDGIPRGRWEDGSWIRDDGWAFKRVEEVLEARGYDVSAFWREP